jgi:hypothetical protein
MGVPRIRIIENCRFVNIGVRPRTRSRVTSWVTLNNFPNLNASSRTVRASLGLSELAPFTRSRHIVGSSVMHLISSLTATLCAPSGAPWRNCRWRIRIQRPKHATWNSNPWYGSRRNSPPVPRHPWQAAPIGASASVPLSTSSAWILHITVQHIK